MPNDLNQLNDEQIAILALTNREAYEILVFRHQQQLLNFIRNRFVSSISNAEAEEIVQEAFLKAYLFLGRFDKNRKWKTWLYKIAINTALSLLRKPKCESIDDHINNLNNLCQEPSPEIDIESNFRKDKLQTALRKLEPADQTILDLYCIKELDCKQVANLLNIPVKIVKAKASRAKKLLTASYWMID